MLHEERTLQRLNFYLETSHGWKGIDFEIPAGIKAVGTKLELVTRFITTVSTDRDLSIQDRNAFVNLLAMLSRKLKHTMATSVPNAVAIKPTSAGRVIGAQLCERYDCDKLFARVETTQLETRIMELKDLTAKIADDKSLSKEEQSAFVNYVAEAIRNLKHLLLSRGPVPARG
jgi:hypothetical protein